MLNLLVILFLVHTFGSTISLLCLGGNPFCGLRKTLWLPKSVCSCGIFGENEMVYSLLLRIGFSFGVKISTVLHFIADLFSSPIDLLSCNSPIRCLEFLLLYFVYQRNRPFYPTFHFKKCTCKIGSNRP